MVTDVRPLSVLVGLRTLSLADCKGLKNVQPLSALVELYDLKLDLEGCYNVPDDQHLNWSKSGLSVYWPGL